MVVIGALIGGVTNSLAIRMLFRPYKAVFIGKWRIPFTPGLIPKRRGELAEQLGRMVVNHLLTPEGLQKKITNTKFTIEMTLFIQEEIRKLLRSNESISGIAERYFSIENPEEKVKKKIDSIIEEKYDNVMNALRGQKIAQLFPETVQEKIKSTFPQVSEVIVTKGVSYFQSSEGKERLSIMIDRFLYGKGTLGNMISMFLGNDRLVDKVQPEVIKFLQDSSTKDLIVTVLNKEWEILKEKEVERLLFIIEKDEVLPIVKRFIKSQVPISTWLEESLVNWTTPYEKMIIENWVPKGVKVVTNQLAIRLEPMLKRLDLEDVVKGQVETFSVERLEEMVLSISKREFKMITYLGAVLGGTIGLIQGILVLIIR